MNEEELMKLKLDITHYNFKLRKESTAIPLGVAVTVSLMSYSHHEDFREDFIISCFGNIAEGGKAFSCEFCDIDKVKEKFREAKQYLREHYARNSIETTLSQE